MRHCQNTLGVLLSPHYSLLLLLLLTSSPLPPSHSPLFQGPNPSPAQLSLSHFASLTHSSAPARPLAQAGLVCCTAPIGFSGHVTAVERCYWSSGRDAPGQLFLPPGGWAAHRHLTGLTHGHTVLLSAVLSAHVPLPACALALLSTHDTGPHCTVFLAALFLQSFWC